MFGKCTVSFDFVVFFAHPPTILFAFDIFLKNNFIFMFLPLWFDHEIMYTPTLSFILGKCVANTRHPPNPEGMCFAAPWEADPPICISAKQKTLGQLQDHDTSSTCRWGHPSIWKKQNCVFSMEWKIGPPPLIFHSREMSSKYLNNTSIVKVLNDII